MNPAENPISLCWLLVHGGIGTRYMTTKSCLAAVRYDQVARGFGNPTIGGMPLLEYVVRGLKRLTPEDKEIRTSHARNLTSIESGVKKGTNRRNAKMVWAAACLCSLVS